MPQIPVYAAKIGKLPEDLCSDQECFLRTVSCLPESSLDTTFLINPAEYVFLYLNDKITEDHGEYLARYTRLRRIFAGICSSPPPSPSINPGTLHSFSKWWLLFGWDNLTTSIGAVCGKRRRRKTICHQRGVELKEWEKTSHMQDLSQGSKNPAHCGTDSPNVSKVRVLEICDERKVVQCPRGSDGAPRNPRLDKFCDFHKDYGHTVGGSGYAPRRGSGRTGNRCREAINTKNRQLQ
ncbi:hypothetical protein F511_37846 [Dorcoceras hygrometricum]|uniref:Uncharacterized protein n=1 Tax=Dorcoceras hygrometricum TaxID=472368 RepID=A0A2Z7AMJ4_9LAMI|nr:hypothetical protein F511_37846 [Dorcoceras hygrometricum]